MLAPNPQVRTQTLNDLRFTRFQLNVIKQGLALVIRDKIYENFPERKKQILAAAQQISNATPIDF